MKHKLLFFVILVSLLMIILPFLLAESAGGKDLLFNGFLLNPIDGNSYLAKMRIGWEGSWVFKLPYTADPGRGAPLFLFYIFLGHLARWTNLTLVFTFHLARVVASLFLIFSMYIFCNSTFKVSPAWARWSFLWVSLGSGMGWLLFPFGIVASDILVPEAYPLLSEFVNPHFPLGLGLLLWVFIWSSQSGGRSSLLILISALGLAIIQPFAVVVGALVLGGLAAWQWFESRKLDWQALFWFLLGGVPFLVYQFWISTTDPVLAGWNLQNQTPSPPLWDLGVAFSPALILAFFSLFTLRRITLNYFQKLTVVWFLGSLALTLVPFSLQRRFLTGFFVPVVILACIGISQLFSSLKKQKRIFTAAYTISVPSLVVIMLLAAFGISGRESALYRTVTEQVAFTWLEANAPSNSLILASPESGNLIPVYTGLRVLYGHPFETVNAASMKSTVTNLFSEKGPADDSLKIIHALKVNYIFFGLSEKKLGSPTFLNLLRPVFQDPDVVIYSVD